MDNIIRLLSTKIPRAKDYHDFADKRPFFGIPNGLDILSNIAIALPVFYLISKEKKLSFLSINILLLAITSAYYHIEPSDKTIFLDMLFVVSVNTVVFSYFVNKEIGMLVYMLGILSVFYWKKYDDIRLYEFLKISIPIYGIYMIHKNPRVSGYIFPMIILSLLIRYSEFNDKEIYKLTNETISGHTLKHIVAGIEIYLVIVVLQKLGKIKS